MLVIFINIFEGIRRFLLGITIFVANLIYPTQTIKTCFLGFRKIKLRLN